MAKLHQNNRFDLDLYGNDLYGWEKEKSKLVVFSLAEQILRGANIPLVDVYQRKDRVFELASPNGGHNRAAAYLILKRPLPVRIVENPLDELLTFNLRDIRLVENHLVPEQDRLEYRMKNDSRYIPFSGSQLLKIFI